MAEETVTAEQSVVLAGTNVPLGKGAAEIVMRQCLHIVAHEATHLADTYYDDGCTLPVESDVPEAGDDMRADASFAMEVVRDEALRMLASGLTLDEMERGWWRISGVVAAVQHMYPKNNSVATTLTDALFRDVRVFPEVWMNVADGDKDAGIGTTAPSARALAGTAGASKPSLWTAGTLTAAQVATHGIGCAMRTSPAPARCCGRWNERHRRRSRRRNRVEPHQLRGAGR